MADCDGSKDYDTKVCCTAQAMPVGGIAELPEVAGERVATNGSSGGGMGLLTGVATVAGLITLGGAAWYARRRWVR